MWYRRILEGRQFQMHAGLFTNALTVMADMSSCEKQAKKEDYDLYEDMDEILILYGYSALFVVACPWVPLLATSTSCSCARRRSPATRRRRCSTRPRRSS